MLKGWRKKGNSGKPQIHVTPRGGLYVDAKELFSDETVIANVKEMNKIARRLRIPQPALPATDKQEG